MKNQISQSIKKISSEQTDRLYQFTREHFVEYYDLQTELVDHLAQGIETQWQENPKLEFENALQNEFKKFGIFGFSDVVEKRQAAMSKRYQQFIWQQFKEYFKLPKIILTLSSMVILFGIFFQIHQYREFAFLGVLVLYIGVYFLIYKKAMKKNKPNKKWMMAEMIYRYGAETSFLPIYFQIPAQLTVQAPETIYNVYFLAIYCIVMVLFVILNHIMIYVIPQKAEDYLRETYPEFELV